jgi:hypothetical protein
MPIERTAQAKYSRRRCNYPLCRRPVSRPDNPGCTSGRELVPLPKRSQSPKPKCASGHPLETGAAQHRSREGFHAADRTMNKCNRSIRSILLPIHPLDTLGQIPSEGFRSIDRGECWAVTSQKRIVSGPLPPRSGGEGSGVGGLSTSNVGSEFAETPPSPDPESELRSPRTPPLASLAGGGGRTVVVA